MSETDKYIELKPEEGIEESLNLEMVKLSHLICNYSLHDGTFRQHIIPKQARARTGNLSGRQVAYAHDSSCIDSCSEDHTGQLFRTISQHRIDLTYFRKMLENSRSHHLVNVGGLKDY